MKTMKHNIIVSKEWLATKIDGTNGDHVLSRALVAIFNNQAPQEQVSNITKLANGVGFTSIDARLGSLAAKTFIKTGKLEPWQRHVWTKVGSRGEMRILKYAGQLNEIALRKLAPHLTN